MTTEINPNATAPVPPPKNGKRRRALLTIAAVAFVALSAWGLWYLTIGRWHVDTDDAYVQGNVVGITPQVGGTVVAIHAEDGMRVEAGQVLVELDPADARVALEQAKAHLASTVRQVRGLYAAVDAGQADLRARQAAVARARADVARRAGLVESGAVSREELAHARNELATAQAALAAAHEDLARNRALVDATTVSDQPQVQAAAAQVRAAYLALQRARIVAPVSGFVAQRRVQLGERVQPGTALMTVIPLDQVWVEANFKETQLEKMRLGQPVTLTSDVYGDAVEYHGKLASLGLGTGSAFSLLPAQNASGNWIKIVQRVPVRIELDGEQLAAHPLRLGMSMSVDVSVRDQDGAVLPAVAQSRPVLETAAYAKQLSEADALIREIVSQNLARHG
ncbi:MAG TPA: HlyD family efflux transporter periplasmic adaptor subunit [Luteimonas sp.]|nr:HlyD family efflux transporter periplasmic adaptor subunit [Luteimonas sp.]